jgi:triacylglycerol lipase
MSAAVRFGPAAAAVALAALWSIAAAPVSAQVERIPPEVRVKLKELGATVSPQMIQTTFQLYAPLQPKAPPGLAEYQDLPYGPDDRHRLDVFAPAAKSARAAPVVVFVPGGGYVGGAKSRAGIPFYQNVGYFFARNGAIGVTMNYRLAPRHPWPAGGEDVAAALRWVRKNIGEFGGDPGRVILFGHSAGGTHVAHYIFEESLQPPGGADGVVGAVVQSGLFDPAGAPPAPNIEAYFGKDRARWAERSLFGKLDGRKIPLFLITAELDPQPFKLETAKLFDMLCKRDGPCPRAKELAGHNHISEVVHLNTADDSMGSDLLAFVRGAR